MMTDNPLATTYKVGVSATTLVADVGVKVAGKGMKKSGLAKMNAKVTAVSGNTVTVSSGNAGNTFTVDATNAKMVRRFGATMKVGDIQVGDMLEVRGTVKDWAVSANFIKDNSLQQKNAKFSGSVTAVSGASFTLASKERGSQAVNTNGDTKIKKNGKVASMSDVLVGATVNVSGVWDNINNNISASNVNIIVKSKKVKIKGTVNSLSAACMTNTPCLGVTGEDGTTYTIDVTAARFVRKFNGKSNLGEVKMGDAVEVQGQSTDAKVQSTDASGIIAATLVKDLSITAKSVKGGSSMKASATVKI